jgi:hypothetical protein
MIEAVKLWNEPNNISHWDFEVDPGWRVYADLVKTASEAVRGENPRLTRVLGGISPIDPGFIRTLRELGALDHLDVVAVHGFPLDWNHWTINEWPEKLREIHAVTHLPVWVTEVGVSTFGADEVQEFGLRRTAELLIGRAPRIHWYSLYDLPRGTAKPRGRHTTATFIWACCVRTAHRSPPRNISAGTPLPSASASGFISRIRGSTMRFAGFGSSGSATFEPDSVGQTV